MIAGEHWPNKSAMVLPKKSIKLPLESQVGFVLAGELVGELVELGISIELEKLVELGLSVALAHSEDISSVDDTIEVCELAVENDESVDESVELTDDKTRAAATLALSMSPLDTRAHTRHVVYV